MSERERLARQLEMQAAWCERHHPDCDCAALCSKCTKAITRIRASDGESIANGDRLHNAAPIGVALQCD
jgi:hypothetical protein